MFGSTVGKSKCSYTLLETSYFYGLKKPGTFGISNRILRDTGTVTGNGDEWDPNLREKKNMVLGLGRDLCGSRYSSVAGLL